MDNVNLVIAENLKDIRCRRGWPQSFVARQLNIAQRTISRAENGIGISRRTLKKLCGLYQVDIATLYNKRVPEIQKTKHIISDDVAVGILLRNTFVQDLQQEVLLRYTDVLQTEALMKREEIEAILPEIITDKKTYTFAEVVSCCMAINQQTIHNITNIAVA